MIGILCKLGEQRLRLLQIARVEAFRKPPVNGSKQFARFHRLALVAPAPPQAAVRYVARTQPPRPGTRGSLKTRLEAGGFLQRIVRSPGPVRY
jgi:hypothetical protein